MYFNSKYLESNVRTLNSKLGNTRSEYSRVFFGSDTRSFLAFEFESTTYILYI